MKKIYSTLLFLVSLFLFNSGGTIFGQLSSIPRQTVNVGFKPNSMIMSVGGFYDPFSWYFPEVFKSAGAVSTYIYTKEEIGGKGKMQFFEKMAMPFAVHGPDTWMPPGYPLDFWDYYFGMEPDTPTPVEIYFRNVPAGTLYSTTGVMPVDISAANGWVKVWDDSYNYFTNKIDTLSIPEWTVNEGEASALVVEFINGFIYTGGDIQVVVKSKTTLPSLSGTSWDDLEINAFHFSYPFLCYRTSANAYPGTSFPGTKFAASYMITNWEDWSGSPEEQGTTYFTGSTSQYSLNLNGIRPMASFTKYKKMEVEEILISQPSPAKLNEADYQVMQINIRTEDTAFPLKARKIKISTEAGEVGSTAQNIVSAKLYFTGKNPEFELIGSTPVGEYYFTEGILETSYEIVVDEVLVHLDEGNNYFWLVYDVPTTNNCGDVLYTKLDEVTLIEFNQTDGVYTPSAEGYNYTLCDIDYAPVVIASTNKTSLSLCDDGSAYTFNIDVSGAIDHDIWERSTDNISWEVYTRGDTENGDTENGINPGHLTIEKEPEYKFYKYTIYGPAGCTNNSASITIAIDYKAPIGDVVEISYDGNENLEEVLEGTILTFTSEVENVPPAVPTRYFWQIDNGSGWQEIAPSVVPSSATPSLELIANTRIYFGKVRLGVEQLSPLNPDDCQLISYSNPIDFSVKQAEFFFTEQPAKKIVSCPNSSMTLQFAYYGSMLDGSWYKDGRKLENKNQIFVLNNLKPSDAGRYYFEAIVSSIDENLQPIVGTVKTRETDLFILDKTSIFKEPENTEAPIGGVAVFKLEANHAGIEPPLYKDDYQWYRRSSTGVVTKLEDNYKYKGTKSNILVISYLSVDDYTYNGAGFYCVVTSLCDAATTNLVTLLPTADDIIIQNQPVDVTVCEEEEIRLSVRVRNNVPAEYQWYKDGTLLVDDGRIHGATTSELTIETAEHTVDNGQYWVEITKPNTQIKLNSNKASVTVNYMIFVARNPNIVQDIKVQVAEDIALELEISSSTDFVTEFYKDGALVETTQKNALETKISYLLEEVIPEFSGRYTITAANGCSKIGVDFEIVVVDENGDPLKIKPSSIVESKEFTFDVTPNPTVGDIAVIFDNSEITHVKIEVLDLKGATIGLIFEGESQVGTNRLEYDLHKNNFPAGTYFVKFTQGEKSFTKQVVFTK